MALWSEDSLVAVRRSNIEHLTVICLRSGPSIVMSSHSESVVIFSVYSKIEADINLHCCG
jgi:hypothetical protein